ncbi:MAG: DUF1345 domain-containing protein [Alphaproteobacteria bacterium]|nr:DUF1345 domain-containing protein [Alphaproteobacteria bacterium]
MFTALKHRPYLLSGIGVGLALYLASVFWHVRPITRGLIAWDAGVTVFLLLSLLFMRDVDLARMKRRACEHDEGGNLIFLLTILAAVASVAALIAELSQAKGQSGATLRVALAAGTVVLSWLFVQIVFALHYAHVYYAAEETGEPRGGLEFGACGEPDYWDFVHFSIVLGATSQTADIGFTSKRMRRIGTLHTLVAFGFNTAILATMINLAAALF